MKTNLRNLSSLALLFILPFANQAQPAAGVVNAPNTVGVSGTVTMPDGSLPVPDGTRVWLHMPDGDDLDADLAVNGVGTVITTTGAFSFASVPRGNYLLRAFTPNVAPYATAPGIVTPLHVAGASVSGLALKLGAPMLTGTIALPGSTTPVRGIAHVYWNGVEVERRWTQTGLFTVGGLPNANVVVRAEAWPGDAYWWSVPTPIALSSSAPQTATLALTEAKIVGTVYESRINPNPVALAQVDAHENGNPPRTDFSGPQGAYAIGGLAPGSALLTLEAPFGLSWLESPSSTTVTVPAVGSINVPITFSLPNKTIHGLVQTNDLAPVSGALVEGHRIDRRGYNATTTDATGAYSMTLSQGLWVVRTTPLSTTVPASWFDPDQTRSVRFEFNPEPDGKVINFRVLVADGVAGGFVQLPNGTAPGVTVTVALHNDEGLGARTLIDANGQYTISVPHGTYKMDVRPVGGVYAGPLLPLLHVGPITPTVVPTITLLVRDAILSGTLTDGAAAVVAGVPVIAWNAATHAAFQTRSGPDGVFDLAVYSGTWSVRPAPLPTQPYIYTGTAQSVTVTAGSTIGNLSAVLVNSNATIHGTLLDAAGVPVTDASGFARAVSTDGAFHNGAPIQHGAFDVLVPAGSYSLTVSLPGGSRYEMPRTVLTTQAPGAISITLVKKDAVIFGALIDKRTGVSPVDVDARVWATDDGFTNATDVRESGQYVLPVSAGDWVVNYGLGDAREDYAKVAGVRTVGVQPGQRQRLGLPVVRKDGVLTGTVTLPDGSPAVGAFVSAEAVSPDIAEVTLGTAVAADGSFLLKLPHGTYTVHSTLPGQPALINPRSLRVVISPAGSASVALRYRQPDTVLSGQISLFGGAPFAGSAWVTAFADDSSANSARVSQSGAYTLPLISGLTYTVVARLETSSAYWFTRTTALVSGPTALNLVLVGPRAKPGPVSIMFDASQDADLTLADGTKVHVPAGAMPVSGNVILQAMPLVNTFFNRYGDVEGMSYAFEAFSADGQPIATTFNTDVSITFPYHPEQLEHRGLRLAQLRPAYFSTTTNSWTRPDSFVNDLTRHEITLQINHFTEYALLAANAAGGSVFLPAVSR